MTHEVLQLEKSNLLPSLLSLLSPTRELIKGTVGWIEWVAYSEFSFLADAVEEICKAINCLVTLPLSSLTQLRRVTLGYENFGIPQVFQSSFNSADGSADFLASIWVPHCERRLRQQKWLIWSISGWPNSVENVFKMFCPKQAKDTWRSLFVICFYESLNKVAKNDKETQINGKIDLAVHYYIKNEDNEEVVT